MVTQIDPASLPPGVSPDCADVAFKPGVPGSTQTRPGTSLHTKFSGNPTLQFFTTFTDLQGNNRNLYFDSLQNFWQEFPLGVFELISFINQSTYAKSDTGFGREFIAFSDGKFGADLPRQWNGTNFDRVSSSGPGAGPTGIVDNLYSIESIQRTSGILTITTSNTNNVQLGDLVTVSGVISDITLNGTWPVSSVISSNTFEAWGVPGQYAINSIQRLAGTVTATFTVPTYASPGDTVIVGGCDDPSFNGIFTIATISGNEVTWAQANGNATSENGTLYTVAYQIAIISVQEQIGATFAAVNATLPLQGFQVGGMITISGNTLYNSTYTVGQIQNTYLGSQNEPAPEGQVFIYFPAIFSVTGFGGIATASIPDTGPFGEGVTGIFGNISVGIHKVAVSFVMRSGYITKPSPPTAWTATGGFQATVSGIPTGPGNGEVVARIVIATLGDGGDYYYSQDGSTDILAMKIYDNTTTTLLLDFSDNALVSSLSANALFDLIVLPEVAGFIQYGDRMCAYGARNMQGLGSVGNFLGMSFDGGIDPVSGCANGWGWETGPFGDGSYFDGAAIWGDSFTIVSSGVNSGAYGVIIQPAYEDYLKNQLLPVNTNLSIRIRARLRSGSIVPGSVISSTITSNSTGYKASASASITTLASGNLWTEFIVPFDTVMPATIPPDMLLGLFATLVGGGPAVQISVDDFEIFPTDTPYLTSVLYGSNVADPESFQGTTGFQNYNENDGRRITNSAIIRDRLYVTKNVGGLFSTTADNSADFSSWDIETISLRTGCESLNGVGTHSTSTGEDWLTLLTRDGLYVFWGPEPVKISQENQPLWDSINWDAGISAWTVTDVAHRRILMGVPLGSATSPSKILQMDYNLCGGTAESLADSPPVSPTYSGQLKAHAKSRKWSIWNLTMNYGAFLEQPNGNVGLYLGNGVGNGNVYQLSDDNLVDVDGPINAYYITSPYPSDEQKQQEIQMKGNRCLLRYLTLYIEGIGNLQLTAYGPGFVDSYIAPIFGAPALALQGTASNDLETFMNFQAERIFLKIQATGDTPWFSVQNGQLYVAESPTATIRGFN